MLPYTFTKEDKIKLSINPYLYVNILFDRQQDCRNNFDKKSCDGYYHQNLYLPSRTQHSAMKPFRCSSIYEDATFYWFDTCIHDRDYLSCGNYSTSVHLLYCLGFECPMHYKCPQSYCVPIRYTCDGLQDCPYGEDELRCQKNGRYK